MAAESSGRHTAGELAAAGRQAWETVSQWLGRRGDSIDVTLLFTELCGFPAWVLEAGDERALELLREVATVVEPCITAHQGKLVKRLGYGHMAVFPEPAEALQAALDMQNALVGAGIQPAGPRRRRTPQPRLRAGLHKGRPQRLEGDYLGADVNIAARISEAARPGEVLISGEVLASLAEERRASLKIKRRRAFRAKGAPPGLGVYCVSAPEQG